MTQAESPDILPIEVAVFMASEGQFRWDLIDSNGTLYGRGYSKTIAEARHTAGARRSEIQQEQFASRLDD